MKTRKEIQKDFWKWILRIPVYSFWVFCLYFVFKDDWTDITFPIFIFGMFYWSEKLIDDCFK